MVNERLAGLDEAIAWMRERGVVSLTIGPESITLGPAPVVAPSGPPVVDAIERAAPPCPCSHDLETEHNEHGCLHGCSVELCASKSGTPRPEGGE